MKDLQISKELLSEVLELKRIDEIYIEDNILYFCELNNGINTYELAHKCKEWAKSKEFIIHSSPTQKIEHTAIVQSFDFNKFYYGENQFYALTEVEAIVKACEWILKELNGYS